MQNPIIMTNKPNFFGVLAQTPPRLGYLGNENELTDKGMKALTIPILLYFGLKFAAPLALGIYALPIAGAGLLCYLAGIYLGRVYNKYRKIQTEIQKLEQTENEIGARPIISRIESLYPQARFEKYDSERQAWSSYKQSAQYF